MTTDIQLPPQLECLHCGHKWIPRQKEVRVCPKCKSPRWDLPPRKTAKTEPLLVKCDSVPVPKERKEEQTK